MKKDAETPTNLHSTSLQRGALSKDNSATWVNLISEDEIKADVADVQLVHPDLKVKKKRSCVKHSMETRENGYQLSLNSLTAPSASGLPESLRVCVCVCV